MNSHLLPDQSQSRIPTPPRNPTHRSPKRKVPIPSPLTACSVLTVIGNSPGLHPCGAISSLTQDRNPTSVATVRYCLQPNLTVIDIYFVNTVDKFPCRWKLRTKLCWTLKLLPCEMYQRDRTNVFTVQALHLPAMII